MDIAESTVKIHITEIFKILEVSTRSQALVKLNDLSLPVPAVIVTDLEILKTFANAMMELKNETWATRIIEFGRSIIKLAKSK